MVGPTCGFTGPCIVCDYCYDASPQNPSRYTSGDPWRWADPNYTNNPVLNDELIFYELKLSPDKKLNNIKIVA